MGWWGNAKRIEYIHVYIYVHINIYTDDDECEDYDGLCVLFVFCNVPNLH